MTGRVRSGSSRTGQALGWPGLAGLPFQGLNSAVVLVLCNGAGGSEPLAHDEWGCLLPCNGRHSLGPGDGAKSPRQGQALHDLVRDQRLLAASSEVHCPVSGQTGGTHQSELGAERESLRRPHGGIVRAKIHESQAS